MFAESQRVPDVGMEVDIPNTTEGWDLGLQNFYPSSTPIGKLVYSRNRYGT
jgi:hypothetical protein